MLVAAAFAATPGVAWAADAKPAAPATTASPAPAKGSTDELAAKWLLQGNTAFADGQFPEAEKAYREAFTLKPVYDIAGNLAMAEFAQSKHRDAAEHLALAIRLFPLTGAPATRDQMQKTFDQCRVHVGVVKVNVATVRGAQVSVDGKVFGEAPLADDLFLNPGKHTISVTAKGYKDASKSVDAVKGVSSVVKLDLVLLPPEVLVRNGTAPPQPQPRSKKPAIALGAVAVVAAGVGVALFVVSGSKRTSAIELSKAIPPGEIPCSIDETKNAADGKCNELISAARSVDTLHNAAVGMFAGAGIAGAAAVVYLLLPPPAAKKAPVHGLQATPIVGSGQAGLLLSGAF